MTAKVKILFLAANPKGSSPLRLDEEIREIRSNTLARELGMPAGAGGGRAAQKEATDRLAGVEAAACPSRLRSEPPWSSSKLIRLALSALGSLKTPEVD